MQNLDNNVELLAPVGDIDSLKQAVYCGANAVYFGYKNFNARRKAENFENLKEVTDFCHLYGVKAYLALNTSIKTEELTDIEEIIKESVEAKIDAYIICDLSLVKIIRKHNKNAVLHASTQMGIHNFYGAKFLKDLGFTRIVLSRETTAKDIQEIKANVDIELEYFIQGALCVSFSGGCLLSSMLSGNSGNRGLCSQLCRHKYQYKDNCGYFLSPKDLCLAKKLKELYKLGINSFKIEGRMRRAEYVANAVSIYRDIIDNNFAVTEKQIDNLKRLYNRGDYTEGYIYSENDIIYDKLNGHKGLFFAKVERINRDRIFIKAEKNVDNNDGFKILRKGIEVGSAIGKDSLLINGFYQLKYNGNIDIGDDLYITTDYKHNLNVIMSLKLPVDIEVRIKANEEILINAKYKDTTIKIIGSIATSAINNPTTKESIIKQFSKVGNTEFSIKDIKVEVDEGLFVSIAELNNLRRQTFDKLKTELLSKYENQKGYIPDEKVEFGRKCLDSKVIIKLNQIEEIERLNLTKIEQLSPTIIISPLNYNKIHTESILSYRQKYNTLKFYLQLPIFANFADLKMLENFIPLFDGVLADNYYGIELANTHNKELILGISMNIFNKFNPLIDYSNMFIASVELSKKELKEFNNSKMLVYAYGNLPLMSLKICYNKIFNMAKCEYCSKEYSLYINDRKNEYLIMNQNIVSCIHYLYNPIITDIGTDNNYTYFLDLSVNKEYNIVNDYVDRHRTSHNIHTKNHLNRGVN